MSYGDYLIDGDGFTMSPYEREWVHYDGVRPKEPMMTQPLPPAEWTIIERHDGGDTYRLEVPGGWLYRARMIGFNGEPSVALVFVPRIDRRE